MTRVRKNDKVATLDYDNSIKKSNEISLAKLNQGLSLNQMQLLAYFIFCTQKNGTTSFKKADFQKKFNITQYRTQYAKEDVRKLMGLKVSTSDQANDEFSFWNVFTDIHYKNGTFTFNWHPNFTQHILDLKEKYIINNFIMTSNFKSSYSWTLYETLKALYNLVHKVFTKEELMSIFGVENVPTYLSNTNRFKKSVLDVAIEEVNTYTELEVSYVEIKKGRKVTGFDIHWSIGEQQTAASGKLLSEIKSLIDSVNLDAQKIILLPNTEYRNEAVQHFADINHYLALFDKDRTVTKDEAEKAYHDILLKSRRINVLLNKKKDDDNTNLFYNWLDERDEPANG